MSLGVKSFHINLENVRKSGDGLLVSEISVISIGNLFYTDLQA